MSEVLDNKSEDEIRRAATWWFLAQEAHCRGEYVPLSVFLLSAEDLTPDDIEWAYKYIAEHPEWRSAESDGS